MSDINKVNLDEVQDFINKIGAFIASVISNRKVSKKDLANKIGISSNTISNACKGLNPNIKTLLAIGKALDLSPIQLISMTEDEIAIELEDMAIEDSSSETSTIDDLEDEEESIEEIEDSPEEMSVSNLVPELFE